MKIKTDPNIRDHNAYVINTSWSSFMIPYPYDLETFKISNELSVNILTIRIVDENSYASDTLTLAVFFE